MPGGLPQVRPGSCFAAAMDGNADGGALEPLLEGEAGFVSKGDRLRRTMSEQLEDLEAAQRAQLADTRVPFLTHHQL